MRNFINLFIGLTTLVSACLEAKARILTFHYNRPDFIEKQYKAFKKFALEDYEIIVFNDGPTPQYEIPIREMCDKYGIQCVRFEQEWHYSDPLNAYIKKNLKDIGKDQLHYYDSDTSNELIANQFSIRHCHVIQFALDHYGYDHDDIVIIMDGDAFPIRPLSFKALLKHSDIIGVQRILETAKVDYLWVIFVAFDPRKLPAPSELKFHVDFINNSLHDSGSATYHYIKNNPSVKVKKCLGQPSARFREWPRDRLKRNGFTHNEISLIKSLSPHLTVEFHMNGLILHYGASSFSLPDHEIKTDYVNKFFDKLLLE